MESIYNSYTEYLYKELDKHASVRVPPRTQIEFEQLLEIKGIDFIREMIIIAKKGNRILIDWYVYRKS